MKIKLVLITLLLGLLYPIVLYSGQRANKERPAQDQQRVPQLPGEGRREGNSKPSGPELRPAELVNLAGNARGVPAEFAADALIKIAQSDKVKDLNWKKELLEEAFRAAVGAQQPVRRVYLQGSVDTREGYLSYAMERRLDALSLQTRAVRAMLEIDKTRARKLFGEIPVKIPLHALNCEDDLIYDLSDYYDTLGAVLQNSFTPLEKQRGDYFSFLETYVNALEHPAQVGPLAKVIASAELTVQQQTSIFYSFSVALKKVVEDDRSFSSSLAGGSMGQGLSALIASQKQEDLKRLLLVALREYLARNLNARRCADNVEGRLNSFLPSSANSITGSLDVGEIKPAEIGGRTQTHSYWQSPNTKRLQTQIKELRFNEEGKRYTEADKESAEWNNKLGDYLNNFYGWDGSDESPEDFFNQKGVLFSALVDIVPPGPARDNIIQSYVAFLQGSPIEEENRVEWLLHVNNLIDFARKDKTSERSKILDTLQNSGDPVLRVYADLERLLSASEKATIQ